MPALHTGNDASMHLRLKTGGQVRLERHPSLDLLLRGYACLGGNPRGVHTRRLSTKRRRFGMNGKLRVVWLDRLGRADGD
jgi:hypothetical protein